MAKEFLVRTSAPSPSGKSPLHSRDSNESYFYPVTRAVSYWPVVNGNGAFFQEENLAPLINSSDEEDGFIGKLINIWHKKGPGTGNQIIGAIKDQATIPGSGIDLMARIDRKAASTYGIEPEDFAGKGEYTSSSIEIFCDYDKSDWVALTNPGSKKLEDQTHFTAEQAKEMGMSRTAETGYKYQDKYDVVEGMSPIRCRGLAFMDDPADSTANVFELAASMNRRHMTDEELAAKALTPGKYHADPGFLPDKKPRYMLDDKEHVALAEGYFPRYKDQYTTEQQAHIKAEIAKAKTRLGMKTDEKATFTDDYGYADIDFSMGFTDPDGDASIPNHYEDLTASEMSDEECNDLPDEAFAATYTTADGHARVRKIPLYRTKADYEKQKPEPGLVKAAIASLSKPASAGGVDLNHNLRAEAKNKVRQAHKYLFPQGANNVDPKEKEAIENAAIAQGKASRDDEVAGLNATISELTTKLNEEKDKVTSLTAEKDELAAKVTSLGEEKSGLEKTISDKLAEEKASARFAELSAIEGFSAGTDEEKASLIEALKAETDGDFATRKLAESNASLVRKVAELQSGVRKDEKASQDGEEQAARSAALRMSLDSVPVHGAKDDKGNATDATLAIM